MIEDIIKLIKDGEGFREKAYFDTKGIKTIGYGFNMEEEHTCKILNQINTNIIETDTITKEESDIIIGLLAEDCLNKLTKILSDNEIDFLPTIWIIILTDMSYNMGLNRLLKFVKMFERLKLGEYDLAINEIIDSNYYEQVGRRSKRNIKCLKENKIVI